MWRTADWSKKSKKFWSYIVLKRIRKFRYPYCILHCLQNIPSYRQYFPNNLAWRTPFIRIYNLLKTLSNLKNHVVIIFACYVLKQVLKQGYVEFDRSASEEHGTRIAKSGSWRSTSVLIPGSACWHPQDLPKRSQVPHGENLPHRDQERTATVWAAWRDAEASPPSLSSRLTTTKKQRSWKGYAPPSLRPEMGRGK